MVQVGNEFGSVEALWSQFENVMAKEPDEEKVREDGLADAEQGKENGRDEGKGST